MKKIFMFLAVAMASAPAHAYLCFPANNIEDYNRDADVIFSGELLSTEDMEASEEELGTPRTRAYFRVNELWKGLPISKTRVTVDTEGLYGYDWKVGQNYLVYGYRINGDERISVVGCPRIKNIERVKDRLRSLGQPKRTRPLRQEEIENKFYKIGF